MPGLIAHQGATVLCAHGGQAQPTTANPRVTVSGQPTITLTTPYSIAGCPLPPNAGGPCATAFWASGTVRVTSMGLPLVFQGGSATCAPTGAPLTVVSTQIRVNAS